jgi:hypothetical protein
MKWILLLFFVSVSLTSYSQKKDSTLYNQFRDYVDWQKRIHKQTIEESTEEKYQMIYVDKYIIDRKRHKIYIFSSYDLYWGGETGLGWEIIIPYKKNNYRKKHIK